MVLSPYVTHSSAHSLFIILQYSPIIAQRGTSDVAILTELGKNTTILLIYDEVQLVVYAYSCLLS